jgi:hypothetical protein
MLNARLKKVCVKCHETNLVQYLYCLDIIRLSFISTVLILFFQLTYIIKFKNSGKKHQWLRN